MLNRIIFVGILLLLFSTGCNNTDLKQEQMRAEIKFNIENFRIKRHTECIQAAYDSANKIVDSLIFKQNLTRDSSSILIKPIKPAKVTVKATIDTAEVKPIIKK